MPQSISIISTKSSEQTYSQYLWVIKGNWITCPKCDETPSAPWHNIRSAISTTRDITCVYYRRCHLQRCCVLQSKRSGRICHDSSSWQLFKIRFSKNIVELNWITIRLHLLSGKVNYARHSYAKHRQIPQLSVTGCKFTADIVFCV